MNLSLKCDKCGGLFQYDFNKKDLTCKSCQHKYSAKKEITAGRSFASKAEAGYFAYLTLLERAGEITDLKCQVEVKLSKANIVYKPDFRFKEQGKTVYAEVKGFETPEWRIKRRLWLAYGPGLLRVIKRTGGNKPSFYVHEELIGEGLIDE